MAERKRPSIREVAVEAKVSVATVSNVLGARKPVNASLASRAHAAVEALGYQPDRAASHQLRSGKNRVVAVLVTPFFTSIMAGLEQAVQPTGYDIVVASSSNDPLIERKRLAPLLSWRPAGVVVFPTDDRLDAIGLLEGADSPFVVVDRLLVASTLKLANIRAPLSASRRRFSRIGLPPPKLTNFTNIGVIASLSQHGFRLPDDVSLVGFDDYAWMQAATPPITAIRQLVERLGAQAWACCVSALRKVASNRKLFALNAVRLHV